MPLTDILALALLVRGIFHGTSAVPTFPVLATNVPRSQRPPSRHGMRRFSILSKFFPGFSRSAGPSLARQGAQAFVRHPWTWEAGNEASESL
jgi:hypothetical protein